MSYNIAGPSSLLYPTQVANLVQRRLGISSKHFLPISGSRRIPAVLAPDVQWHGAPMGWYSVRLCFCCPRSYPRDLLALRAASAVEKPVRPSVGQGAMTRLLVGAMPCTYLTTEIALREA